MGFNLGKELNKLKEFAFDAAPYVAMAAPFIPGVNAGVMSLMGKHAPWMQKAMQSKFMNSVMGASVKDALMSYTMAKLQDKENPHLIAKNALMRNMFVNANKVGWDMDMMMGGDPTIPDPIIEDKTFTIPGGEDFYNYHPKQKSLWGLAKDPALGADAADLDMLGLEESFKPTQMITNLEDLQKPLKYQLSPTEFVKKDVITNFGDMIEARSKENPLAGMGFMTTTKTQPSMLDKLLGRGKDLKELGITAGTPEYDEYFGIGETRPDMAKMLGLGMDYFSDPLTETQQERKEQEEYERKMARLMWPRSMDDIPDFQKGFLGYKNGGLASLANGGRIGYQGGGIGPAGATLEETPMAARKDVTIKSQLEDLYKLYMEKGLLTPGLAKMLGWDDPNEYYNNELWQRDFGDPYQMEGPITKQFYDEMAMEPEGAGPMTPTAPIDFDDDFIFDEGTIGPNPTFEDEFGGYLDLASGPDNQGMYDAYENYKMDGGTLNFEDWKISIQEVMNPEDWAASRGGKTPKMYGGGDLNAIPGGMVSGPGTETSDSIPAQLSNNEFVVTADAVRAAGGGDIDLGAQKFYGIMNALDPNSAKLGEPPVYS